jgi:glyoxylase-like metal-dependent hydrolase (beta-lactamase superfamily II)/8-oxo-dGTP pyrophosphatase MutT (NUDIX family)
MTSGVVEPRPAATVVLLRPGPEGLQVLLTRRPTTMAFAADMHVFPGGRVDAADTDAALAARSVVSAMDASTALGGDLSPGVALAAWIAAIRELFEEAGVLLADGGDGLPVPTRSVSLARSALVGGEASFSQIAADLDLRLRTDLLAPLSRWVTPASMSRRFDTRFFAAQLPTGSRVSFEGDEVAGHAWRRPADALDEMTEGRMPMWLPTSTTLQQLEHADSVEQVRARLPPGRLGVVDVEPLSPVATRIVMPAGGGVAGQPVCAYLIGRHRYLLIDPGDPTGPGLDVALGLAAAGGGTIEGIALTHVDPDHAAGAATLAEVLGIPVFTGPGGGRPLPYAVSELHDGEVLPVADVPIRAVSTPGPRPDHLAFVAGDGAMVVSGDLVGARGARSIFGPPDDVAWAASRERLARLAPGVAWWSGHPAVGTGS